uniref:helix-turn-helix domain-containing protein n=1 Tax=Halomonas sp. TaxID=1486246 RepID=UPI0026320BE1|nr:helix-turn-helix transcriptional regulator [Halomonas sp.]
MDTLSLGTLGEHLQSLRIAQGLSLSQLATQAGIAKSNLSRLEQGQGNPTLDTLWRLAVQLQVPFGTLVKPISIPLGEDGVQVQLIDQGKGNPPVDAYWMRCAPHTSRHAEAHTPGARETITVISGEIQIGPEGALQYIKAGESTDFEADRPHQYTTGESWATLLVTIIYASSRGAAP